LLLKRRRLAINKPNIEPKPQNTDNNRPANKGSAIIFKNGIIVQIKNGGDPTERGKNLKEGSALITCAHLI